MQTRSLVSSQTSRRIRNPRKDRDLSIRNRRSRSCWIPKELISPITSASSIKISMVASLPEEVAAVAEASAEAIEVAEVTIEVVVVAMRGEVVDVVEAVEGAIGVVKLKQCRSLA